MWPTVDGTRKLQAAEAQLVARAIGEIVRQRNPENEPRVDLEPYGIDWFDQWDDRQQLWLMEQIAIALLGDEDPPPPAAMWEATVDAVFCEVMNQITAEIDARSFSSEESSWCELTIDAFRCQTHRSPAIDRDQTDPRRWRALVTQISDLILGVPSYQKAESFRDRDVDQLRRFLKQKGLPEDFLERIPPLRTPEQARKSVSRIERIIARL